MTNEETAAGRANKSYRGGEACLLGQEGTGIKTAAKFGREEKGGGPTGEGGTRRKPGIDIRKEGGKGKTYATERRK